MDQLTTMLTNLLQVAHTVFRVMSSCPLCGCLDVNQTGGRSDTKTVCHFCHVYIIASAAT